MITLESIRDVANALPEVTEKPHFGHPGFRVRDTLFLSVHPDDEPPWAIAHVSQERATAETESDPDTFEPVWRRHGGRNLFVGLRIDLSSVTGDRMAELTDLAWRHRAPKRLVAARDTP